MGGIGFPELIIIFLVLLLVFGAKRIPEIARGIGKGIREFKDATNEISREIEAESQGRQINQPQTPRQGTPQSRRNQQQAQQQAQQQSPPQETSAETAENADGEAASQRTETSEAEAKNKTEAS